MYLQISLFTPPYSSLTYKAPICFPDIFWRKGMRVLVPLGRGIRTGLITSTSREPFEKKEIAYKDVIWPLEKDPLLDSTTLAMVDDLACRQNLLPGFILGHVLPQGLRDIEPRLYFEKRKYSPPMLYKLPDDEKGALVEAFRNGSAAFERPEKNENEILALNCEPPWAVRPAALIQHKILNLLYTKGALSRKSLQAEAGAGINKALESLFQKKLVKVLPDEPGQELLEKTACDFTLSQKQTRIAKSLISALYNTRQPEARLLFGVTGSGKTAVYMEVCKASLCLGKSVFVLAPEVALAQKLASDFQKTLPDTLIILYHGYQAPGRREKIWKEVCSTTKPVLVVGTRSALFLPLRNVGCIIMDEEHDASYKQDENFAYHAKELAWFRTEAEKGLLILGSATPDIRTFYASENRQVQRDELSERVTGKPLPPVEFVSLAKIPVMGPEQNLLAPQTISALEECAAKGEQAVILLNRRGYAPMIYCIECSRTLRCPNCSIGLAYHKNTGNLICHYCGYSVPYPSPCPECGKMNYLSIGEGTERLTEHLERIAGVPVLRLDRDNTRAPGKIENILDDFAKFKSPFLVGTQMLSKGHHFPNVTLAVVADGDIGLNLPDYRAAERTFQLLTQAAGRAGRGQKQGRVIIQTRNPGHYCWTHLPTYDYRAFYEEELGRRKKFMYPPFTKLALLRFSCLIEDNAAKDEIVAAGKTLAEFGRKNGIKIMGPAPAPISVLRGRMRFHCLIKADNWKIMREIHSLALRLIKNGDIRIFLDLDPVNML